MKFFHIVSTTLLTAVGLTAVGMASPAEAQSFDTEPLQVSVQELEGSGDAAYGQEELRDIANQVNQSVYERGRDVVNVIRLPDDGEIPDNLVLIESGRDDFYAADPLDDYAIGVELEELD